MKQEIVKGKGEEITHSSGESSSTGVALNEIAGLYRLT
jgi:hypothetical protein